MEGKSARLPFPPVTERKSAQILDIVHTDLCGPMRTVTPNGNRYVMNIIDDFSRFTVTYLLKSKDEAIDCIKEYVRWAETQMNRKPKVIRSDGGGEFNNNELRRFYKQEGIKPQFTTPYSPQQNGVAERKNRALSEMASCMLIDAGMEKRFWGEAMLTATYLQNRLPSRSLKKTPFELWWGRKPDLRHIRVFGSEAFVHVPDVKRGKLDSKARKLKFVGYCMDQKGYRFLVPGTDNIVVSRDARFIELGNSSSSVEFPLTEADTTAQPSAQQPEEEEEDLKLPPLPDEDFGDEEEEEGAVGGDTDSEEFFDTGNLEELPEELRRSGRQNKGVPPGYLQDFELGTAGIAACAVDEPVNFKQAVKVREWRCAMDDELESHRRNGTWELVPLPPGRKTVGSRWVYKIKRNERNEIVKYKARIVAQGHTQRYGEDFEEVFAPVARHATLRTFFAVTSKRKLIVHHLDVKTAYLYGSLDEDIFMRQPPGCVKPGQEQLVCHLKRSIYGLRQSARCWCKRLQDVLLQYGFKRSGADPCLYTKMVGGSRVILIVYVDDILLGSSDEDELKRCFDYLNAEFELTSLGQPRHFLGMEIAIKEEVYHVRLMNYIDKLVETNGMVEAKVAKTPMDVGYLKTKDTSDTLTDPTKYRSLVGGLLYLAVIARPDIAAAAAILGRKFAGPTESDWTAAKRVLRFLKGTKEWYLKLGGVMVMREDNQGCLAFVRTERSNRRSKHINTRERYVQELCLQGEAALEYCPTDQMIADIFTKPLGPQKHQVFREMLGLG